MIIVWHAVIHVWHAVNHVYHGAKSVFHEFGTLYDGILKKFFQIMIPLQILEFWAALHIPYIPYLMMQKFKVCNDHCILNNDNCLLCSDHCLLCNDHCLIGKNQHSYYCLIK